MSAYFPGTLPYGHPIKVAEHSCHVQFCFCIYSVCTHKLQKKKHVFNQPHCHGNSTHLSQNAGINPSVVNLDSCEKQALKHNQFKNTGELDIGI